MTRLSKGLIIGTGVALLVALVTYLITLIGIVAANGVERAALTIAYFSALFVMIAYGSIMDTPYWKYLLGSFGIVILGAIFKVMHLEVANEISLLGDFLLVLVYGIHFLKKPAKQVLDVIKMLWLVTASIRLSLTVLHRNEFEFDFIVFTIFWVMFGWFLFLQWRQYTSR